MLRHDVTLKASASLCLSVKKANGDVDPYYDIHIIMQQSLFWKISFQCMFFLYWYWI